MNISIRHAAIEDAVRITGLSGQLGYDVSEKETTQYLQAIGKSDNDVVYVAEVEHNVIGWMQVSYMVRIESGFLCEIVGLVVDEQYRGKGVGKLMIGKAVDWCRGKGCHKLKVRSNTKRIDTHRFYTNAGFVEVKEQKVFEMTL